MGFLSPSQCTRLIGRDLEIAPTEGYKISVDDSPVSMVTCHGVCTEGGKPS